MSGCGSLVDESVSNVLEVSEARGVFNYFIRPG